MLSRVYDEMQPTIPQQLYNKDKLEGLLRVNLRTLMNRAYIVLVLGPHFSHALQVRSSFRVTQKSKIESRRTKGEQQDGFLEIRLVTSPTRIVF